LPVLNNHFIIFVLAQKIDTEVFNTLTDNDIESLIIEVGTKRKCLNKYQNFKNSGNPVTEKVSCKISTRIYQRPCVDENCVHTLRKVHQTSRSFENPEIHIRTLIAQR
jgi:hypothetical protein